MTGRPPFRDFLSDDAPPPESAPPRPIPRPGHGRVWINGGAAHDWSASWQDGPGILDSMPGTRDDAIAAARRMPAADRVIFSAADNDYVDLDEWFARQS